MFDNFMSVFQQVVILFILIAVGFFCGKRKMFDEDSIKKLSIFVLYFVTPCVIINAFNRDFDVKMLNGLLVSFAAATIIHVFNIIMAHLFVHDKNYDSIKVYRFTVVFSNCGFMAIPLQQALLGDEGVFYAASYIGVFNIFSWSYGNLMMAFDRRVKLSPVEKKRQILESIRKCFLNPGVIGVSLGLLLFFLPIHLPKIIASPVQSFAYLNTPLPMVIIGFYLSQVTSFEVLKKFNFWLVLVLRLIVSPAVFMCACYFCGIRGTVLGVLAIASCTPAAANTAMFASLYERDTPLASELVSISTLFSIATMPVIITVAMSLM